jgi:spore germination protein GerM
VQLPPTPAPPQPTPPPVATRSNEVVWLYFGDSTGTLYVPVQRRVVVENRQSARAALLALFAGPQNGMASLVEQGTQLHEVRIENGTAIVNLDRNPGDERAYDAIVLTLTHFSSIQHVQIQVNGQNVGGPRNRPIVNPINPLGLPVDYSQTEFLPLYFVSNSGYHVRVIRMVPKTRQTAESTTRALLEGPGAYSYALQRVIPAGTELRNISINRGIVTVDFTQAFASTSDRHNAVRTVTESLTTLPTVRGVRILVEGAPVSNWWGDEYARVFERPLINGE